MEDIVVAYYKLANTNWTSEEIVTLSYFLKIEGKNRNQIDITKKTRTQKKITIENKKTQYLKTWRHKII